MENRLITRKDLIAAGVVLGAVLLGVTAFIGIRKLPTWNVAAYRAYSRGVDLDGKNKWKEAQAEYQKAVELDPAYGLAWLQLGRMYENQAV